MYTVHSTMYICTCIVMEELRLVHVSSARALYYVHMYIGGTHIPRTSYYVHSTMYIGGTHMDAQRNPGIGTNNCYGLLLL